MPNPVQVVTDSHIDSGHSDLSAADSPRNHTSQLPNAVLLAHQRTASVTLQENKKFRLEQNSSPGTCLHTHLASVLSFLSSCADESRVQFETVSQAGVPQLLLALLVVDDWHVDLLQDVLVLAKVTECVLTPSRGPATGSGKVRVLLRQAGWADVGRLGVVQGFVELQDGNVVVQGTSIVLRVDMHRDYITLDVRIEFNVVVNVPFSQADTEIESTVLLDAMSGSDDVLVINQSASASVDGLLGILLQNGRLPGVLAELTVSIHIDGSLNSPIDSLSVSGSTLAQRSWWRTRTVGSATTHVTRSALLLLLDELLLLLLLRELLLLVFRAVESLALKG